MPTLNPKYRAAVKNHNDTRERNRAAAAHLLPGHLVRCGGMPVVVVADTNTQGPEEGWTVTVLNYQGLERVVPAGQVERVFPSRSTAELHFPTEADAGWVRDAWRTARDSCRGPVCPECGCAGTTLESNGQGGWTCSWCDTEFGGEL